MARQLAQHLEQQRAMFSELMERVGTLDATIFEHDTQELPPTQATFTLNLNAQTAQTEYIHGLFVAIVCPQLTAAPTITITNAWAQLGSDYVNLNAIINSSGGTGGMLSGPKCRFILGGKSVRQVNIVASADFPAAPNPAFLSFALFGEAIPTMD